jgi:hypothetical protein
VKRTVTGLALIAALLLSAATGAISINLAVANPIWVLDFPTEPILKPPTVVVHLPVQNHNYKLTDMLLNFTIIKPDTWFNSDKIVGADEDGNSLYAIYGNITSVYYIVDNGERQNISMYDTFDLIDVFPKYYRNLNFSINLKLSEGVHDVIVGFEADSFYVKTDFYTAENATATIPAGTRIPHTSLSAIEVNGFSDIIHFSVGDSFPTTFVTVASAVSVSAAGLGFLFYFKKSRTKNNRADNKVS